MFIDVRHIIDYPAVWRDELPRLGYRHMFVRSFPSWNHISSVIDNIDLGRETEDWTFYQVDGFDDGPRTLRFCFKNEYDAVYAALIL